MSSLCGVSFISGYFQWFHSIFGLYTTKISCVYVFIFLVILYGWISWIWALISFIFFLPDIISSVFLVLLSVFCWDFPVSHMWVFSVVSQAWEALNSFYHIFFSLCFSFANFLVYLYSYWLFLGFIEATHKKSLFLWLCPFCLAFPLNSST